ncbi:hypothetical protein [Mesorhizobium sp.]|uniref:hypothetical protein n=1 Tax=Mesorhizobium sp. TaxID=1871066 RepID=UPI000FE2B886|nr:hypothetical protein [Mesorhizobium sp.]RWJ03497.1 MAG: hypothetical protein EOR24_32470 [Mesorhizobium sp.]
MAEQRQIDWWWGKVFITAGIVGFLIQIFWFLRYGTWSGLSLIDAAKFGSDWPWLYDPQSWQGLHLILNWVSLPLVLIGWGLLLREAGKPLGPL